MNATPSQSESHAMLKWLNSNRQQLKKYAHQYVAYNANGIIANSENLREILQLAEASGQLFSIYLVPGFTASVVILPIYFRTVSTHEWSPNYQVNLKHKELVLNATMVVDSGADFSIIIRTAIESAGKIKIQSGGAIVYDSSLEEEWAELIGKIRFLLEFFSLEK